MFQKGKIGNSENKRGNKGVFVGMEGIGVISGVMGIMKGQKGMGPGVAAEW